jgi:hypothetical protein
MKFTPIVTIFSALAASVAAAPLSLGNGGLLGINLNPNDLNVCIFANVATLSLRPNIALDTSSNTCITVNDCLSVKTREVVLKPVLAGLIQVGFCQTKTCPSGQILVSGGLTQSPTFVADTEACG